MRYFMTLISLFLIQSFTMAQAAYHQAPPSFPYQEGRAVFVDFDQANYEITYDLMEKKAWAESTITFYVSQPGYPIFDLVPNPLEVSLNGVAVETEALRDPDHKTVFRVLKRKVQRGRYQLKVKHQITSNVIFNDKGIASGFWMSDLNDRRYLEQYLPANLEYDQYKMTMNVRLLNTEGITHLLKANGKVSEVSPNHFEIEFPDFYSTSSVYFHLFPEKNKANTAQFYYPSIDGRLIPVDIYTIYDVAVWVNATKTILAELEADYGPFPHEQLIIYGNALSGGMEHSGATATSLSALGHELFHSYHARALMPANGNAGWMDEAIARWRDNKYPLTAKLNFQSTRLAGHSAWSRMTDRMAYTEGSAFLSWIAFRMNEKGLSFKQFLRDYFEQYKYTTVTTPLFQEELTKASGLDLAADFDQYIYGKYTPKSLHVHEAPENPYHPRYTPEQLLEITWL